MQSLSVGPQSHCGPLDFFGFLRKLILDKDDDDDDHDDDKFEPPSGGPPGGPPLLPEGTPP